MMMMQISAKLGTVPLEKLDGGLGQHALSSIRSILVTICLPKMSNFASAKHKR